MRVYVLGAGASVSAGYPLAAAITAACSILEALFKVYIEDNGIEMPADQSLKPLWKAASKHLGLDPAAIEDDDCQKGSVWLKFGRRRYRISAHAYGFSHGHGRRKYHLQPRHAKLSGISYADALQFTSGTW